MKFQLELYIEKANLIRHVNKVFYFAVHIWFHCNINTFNLLGFRNRISLGMFHPFPIFHLTLFRYFIGNKMAK